MEYASLFIMDPDGQDRDQFDIHPESEFSERFADQIVLDAEHRSAFPLYPH